MVLHFNYKTTHSSSVIQRGNSLSGELHSKILTNSHQEFIMKKIVILFLVFVCANLLAQTVTTLAGSGSHGFANGTGTAASFKYPDGVAVDESGNVYVADVENHLIRKITSAGVVTTFAGSGSKGSEDGTGTAASFILLYSPHHWR